MNIFSTWGGGGEEEEQEECVYYEWKERASLTQLSMLDDGRVERRVRSNVPLIIHKPSSL